MRTITLIFFSLVFVLLYTCKSDSKELDSTLQEEQAKNNIISQKDINNLKYTDYILSGEANTVILDWSKYQELNSHIDFLKKADFSFFKTEKDTLKSFLKTFKEEIPFKVKTNIVQSRITALETKILLLNSTFNLDNISKEERIKTLKEVLEAYANLNLQINKKLELDANNIERPF